MRHQPINSSLFIKNRKNFVNKMKPNSVAIFLSNDIMPTNADGTMPFVQNTNLLYLSGINQEDSILILAPDFHDKKYREILFVRETNQIISIWEGNKLTKKEAEILMLLCEQKGKVVERNLILKLVWGDDSYFNGRSLDVFISKLRKYLREDPSIAIQNIHGIGFCLQD